MGKVFRDGTHPGWAVFSMIYVIGAFGLSIYWLITTSGWVASLARWQARHLFNGKWYPKMTTLVVLIGFLVPLLLLKLVIEAVTGKKLTSSPLSRS